MNARKTLSRILTGLIFIVIGIGYVGKFAGIWPEFTVFFPGWWTLFIIIPMLFSVVNDGPGVFNVAVLLIGVALLLSNDAYGIIEFKQFIWIALAALLILIGIRITFEPSIRRAKYNRTLRATQPEGTYYADSDGKKKVNINFSSSTENFDGQVFEGADASVSFGEITLDLRGATFTHDTAINANASFGTVKILLPANINIKLETSSLFGAVNNRHINPAQSGLPTVFINAGASFGSVDIS